MTESEINHSRREGKIDWPASHSAVTSLPRSSRSFLRKALFTLSGIQRIHIIGCSRSGTTMLHLAMVCFTNVALSETETDPGYPSLRTRAQVALRMGWHRGRKFYVTKRDSGWYKPWHVERLLAQTRFENIGIIHLVRDPRDVMLSRYTGSKQETLGQAYVTSEHWYQSILAADHIFASLSDHPGKLTLRYEDIVLDPDATAGRIANRFGLTRNPRAFTIDRIKDNFERLNIRFGAEGIRALNGLRNMDAHSVARWRHEAIQPDFEGMTPKMRARLETFCAEHGYEKAGNV